MSLLDDDGRPAVVGKSLGYWLDPSDFKFSGIDHQGDTPSEMGPHTFPRDWPDVYQWSDSLRFMVRKKGPCGAQRVSAIPPPEPEHRQYAEGLQLRWLQSKANAEAVRDQSGLSVVEGWAIFDLLDDVTGAAFVAERYWWNALEDGTWLDFSPWPEQIDQILLAEALNPGPVKQATVLTAKQLDLAEHLLALRFPKAVAAAARAARLAAMGGPAVSAVPSQPPVAKSPAAAAPAVSPAAAAPAAAAPSVAPTPSPAARPQVPSPASTAAAPVPAPKPAPPRTAMEMPVASATTTEDPRTAVRRVKMGLVEPVHEMLDRLPREPRLAEDLVRAGMCSALASRLRDLRTGAGPLKLLAELAQAGIAGYFSKKVSEAVLAADGIDPIVELVGARDLEVAANAAVLLGHLCYKSPTVQTKAVKSGAIRHSLRLLARRREGDKVLEGAYCLWQLQAKSRENSRSAFEAGAALSLLRLLNEGQIAPQALLNVLGAVTSLLTTEGARDALGDTGTVQVLCGYLEPPNSKEVRSQALAALMNLLCGHGGNCRKALASGKTTPAVLTLLADADLPVPVRVSGAGALANLIAHGGRDVANTAISSGALEALKSLLPSVAKPVEILGALANIALHMPEHRPAVIQTVRLEMVVAMVTDDNEDLAVRMAALGLCTQLALHTPAKPRLLRTGMVKPLVVLIERDDQGLKERAAAVLANLMEGHAETVAKVFLQVPDLPRRLVYVLGRETSKRAKRNIAKVLAMLASREVTRAAVREAGGTGPLATVMQEDQAGECALALLNLAPGPLDMRMLLKKGAIPALVKLLQDRESRAYAAGALANLTAGCAEVVSEARKAGAVSGLTSLLLDAEVDTVLNEQEASQWAAATVGHILEYSDTASRQQAAEGGLLGPLIKMLKSDEELSQDIAIFALSSLIPAVYSKEDEEPDPIIAEAAEPLEMARRRMPDGLLRDRAESLLCLVR